MKLPMRPSQLDRADYLFLYFIAGLLAIMLLYGLGMVLVLLFGSEPLGLRMITAFAAMFTGVLGLGTGYLLGTVKPTDGMDKRRDHSHDRGK